jgi:hypothetical protein
MPTSPIGEEGFIKTMKTESLNKDLVEYFTGSLKELAVFFSTQNGEPRTQKKPFGCGF